MKERFLLFVGRIGAFLIDRVAWHGLNENAKKRCAHEDALQTTNDSQLPLSESK